MENFAQFLPMALVLLAIYLFLILPNRRKQKRKKRALERVRPGDEAVTAGGIRGRVVGSSAGSVTIEVAPGVRFDVDKSKVETVNAAAAGAAPSNVCRRCGASMGAGDRFCGECRHPADGDTDKPGSGARIQDRCRSCGADLIPGERFCGECGTPAG